MVQRFKRRYSPEERRAIVDAIVVENMTAPAAVAAAQQGDLGVEPFEMPVGTARHLAAQERQRATAADPSEWERSQVRRAKEKLDEIGRKLYGEAEPDPGKIARHAKAVGAVADLLRDVERRSARGAGSTAPSAGTNGQSEGEAAFFARLEAAAAAEDAARPEHQDPVTA